jgi:hypothetical protein
MAGRSRVRLEKHLVTLTMPPALPGWLARLMELRIDVQHGPKRIDGEIAAIHERIRDPRDRLHRMPRVPLDHPELVIRHREADGEFYVYVEDVRRGQLAGYTVFNRLVEVPRRADRHLRAPIPSTTRSTSGAAWRPRSTAGAWTPGSAC